jgi:uncharacterized protein
VTEAAADIVIDRDAEVRARDGTVLRVNVFRGPGVGPLPAIVSIHPYGKDKLPARRGKRWTYPFQYRVARQPDPVCFSALTGWEAPDPVWWVEQGFAVVNADLRGCGHSEGTGRMFSRQESNDAYDVVQWVADQPWCNGRVVMLGVSYLAISQYDTAPLHPPALRAICPWEGFTDPYRDVAFPGGIRERGFMRNWGLLVRRTTRQAYDMLRVQKAHPLRDQFWGSLVPDLSAITVPMLVCGSLHSSGSMRAFTQAASTHARLYTHRGGKWSTFYSEPARAEQLAFLRGVLAGTAVPARSVRLEVREDRDTIDVDHIGFDGQTHRGELIVHHDLVPQVIIIFEQLYRLGCPGQQGRGSGSVLSVGRPGVYPTVFHGGHGVVLIMGNSVICRPVSIGAGDSLASLRRPKCRSGPSW